MSYAFQDRLDSALSSLTGPSKQETVENLRAFAKLYGYVRFFHPSDAAANTDWEKFAIHGVRQVKDAISRTELKAELEALFKPIAPTVQLYRTGTEPPSPADVLVPSDTSGLKLVAWQHKGVGLGNPVPYESRRLHRGPGEEPLFEARPAPGEVVNKPLGRGLSAQVPLALYSRKGQTLRPAETPAPGALRDQVRKVFPALSNEVEGLYPGNVAIAWNVFQHFYPYFEVVDVDWDRVLTRSLRRSLADTSRLDFRQTLRRMVARLKDGHGRVHHPHDLESQLPLRFDQIEGEVVVVDTASYARKKSCARPGDVVKSIDGTPIEKELRAKKRFLSGSPQWKTVRALRQLGTGPPGTTISLTLRRKGQTVECQVLRADALKAHRWQQALKSEPRPSPIGSLSEGVRYVNLTRVDMDVLQPHLDSLARAEAVIFDMRGYPEDDNEELLRHLSSDTLQSAHFKTLQSIYPDQHDIVGYIDDPFTLSPKRPRFTGDITFLTDARAISYAESIMGIVEHYNLGTIVGQQTAGTNGVVNPFNLPGGYNVRWTGQRTCKHDGSQHHLVGIEPDVQAERTVEGVRYREDEVLQKALEVLRKTKRPTTNEGPGKQKSPQAQP